MRDKDNQPKFHGKAASETSERTRPNYIVEAEEKIGTEELNRRLKGQLCLKCGKKGHRSNKCRAREWNAHKEKGKAAEVIPEDKSTDSESEK